MHQKVAPLVTKQVLVSQTPTPGAQAAYSQLAQAHGWEVDFVPFTINEPVSSNEFRKYQAIIPQHTAIIFTSTIAIDFFFNSCQAVKIALSPEMRYFCTTEHLAAYLQKYVQPKKRKITVANGSTAALKTVLSKYPKEKFLLPCSSANAHPLVAYFTEKGHTFAQIPVYTTLAKDLSKLPYGSYQVIVFFTPAGVRAFVENFPQASAGTLPQLAAFGQHTRQALEDAGLAVAIHAPTPEAPSMVQALTQYLQQLAAPVPMPSS